MPCYHPLPAFRSPAGDITFNVAGFLKPNLQLPCGRCIGCRLERSRQWAVRIMHEAQLHKQNCFVTLTYDAEHLPADLSLDYRHVQGFLKRYRKQIYPKFIRYFVAGEYGDKRQRPHYHAIIFGHLPDDLRLHSKTGGNELYTSEFLSQCWGFGFVSIGALTFQSAAYVARYVVKKVTGPQADRHYEMVDPLTGELTKRMPEFCRMSLKPGIGAGWYAKFKGDVFPHDYVVTRGSKNKPPRYYDKLLEREDPDLMQSIKDSRAERAKDRQDDFTAERLAVKETVDQRRVSDFLKRKLK